MAYILQKTNVVDDLYDTIFKWSGGLRGWLAIATVIVGAILGAVSGVVAAGVIGLGLIGLPQMLKHGYNKTMALGCVLGGGTLGQLIPPSTNMVLYGCVTGVSIGGLFAGGLGLMGQPHILQRFITARDDRTLITSAVIGVVWVLIQTSGSTLIGIVCRVMMPTVLDPEFAFPLLVVQRLHPLLAGVVLAAVFSAILSTLDSLIVLVAQTVHLDIIKGVLGKKLPEKRATLAGRAVIASVGLFGAFIALQHQRIVFWFVLYAFAVMGASFAPPLLLSLYCSRVTGRGALYGMLAGAVATIFWYNMPPLKGLMYEMLPAFIVSAAVTVAVSFLSPAPRDGDRQIGLTRR